MKASNEKSPIIKILDFNCRGIYPVICKNCGETIYLRNLEFISMICMYCHEEIVNESLIETKEIA